MRYVVIGAGAVGGATGGRLHQHGHSVVLVARGAHFEALRRDGLRLRDPEAEVKLDVPVVSDPVQVDWREDDVVVLATKTHQTPAALDRLAAVAPSDVPIVCLQNGLANERMALRLFPNVHGITVMLPATHLHPGSVVVHSLGCTGILDVGGVPDGIDEIDARVAADLESASFSSRPVTEVLAWKRAKLLRNLENAIEAACGELESDAARMLATLARTEAEACYVAAGWSWIDDATFEARRHGVLSWRPIEGVPRVGSSTWQSLLRRNGTTEVDYLNGEIVLLGRSHGVPTPANALLQTTIRRMAGDGNEPGTLSAADLVARLGAHSPSTPLRT